MITKQHGHTEPVGQAPRMSSDKLSRLSDRDLRDLGLSRGDIARSPGHAPFEVPNDRI
ncbi:MAG: DUF1127 domain-containing protein [Rhodospirillaceae bacterium]|nr:DUF1127 domain-containing protein [Rhodospirillaceae bacterium]